MTLKEFLRDTRVIDLQIRFNEKKKTARTEKQFEFGSVREFFAAGMHAISLPRDTSAEHRYNYSTKFCF